MNSRQCTDKLLVNPGLQSLSVQAIQSILGGNQVVELRTINHSKKMAKTLATRSSKGFGKVVLPPAKPTNRSQPN